MWKRRLARTLLLLGGLGLILYPGACADAAREALVQCGSTVLPALFPFLVLSALVVQTAGDSPLLRGFARIAGPVFHINEGGSTALLLGLVGGYPIGARTVRDLYESGDCSKEQCQHLLLFCNNASPAFLLSTAGAAVLGSLRAGWLLWLGHALSAFLLGIVTRPRGFTHLRTAHPQNPPTPLSQAFLSSVTGGADSALRITAFVTVFAVLVRLLEDSGVLRLSVAVLHLLLSPLGLTEAGCSALLCGGLELTRGILMLTGQPDSAGVLALAAFLLGWGGLSVHGQTAAVLHGSGLSLSGYLLGKLCHGVLAAAVTFALAVLIPPEPRLVTVSAHGVLMSHALPLWLAGCGLVIVLLAAKGGSKAAKNSL